jgi:hypothetical protein
MLVWGGALASLEPKGLEKRGTEQPETNADRAISPIRVDLVSHDRASVRLT